MKRDLYIDVVKGFATLSVIFIHTVFWSGQFYVPTELRNLSLLFDVPIFFFLSGLTSSGKVEKNIHRMLKLQISYMIFISLVFIIWCISNQTVDWRKLFDWYFHNYTASKPLDVVIGSMWYMRIYFMVSFCGVLVLRYLSGKQINVLIGFLAAGVLLFSFYYYPAGNYGYIFVYLLMFLTAHQCRNIFVKIPYAFLGFLLLAVVYFLLFLYFGDKTTMLVRKQKFPPNIIYFTYSCFSLFLILVLKGRLVFNKNNFLAYIGQNAIFYYFAQGISSSLLYIPVLSWKDSFCWYYLLPIMFITNVILAIILAEIVKRIDSLGWKLLYFIKEKTV